MTDEKLDMILVEVGCERYNQDREHGGPIHDDTHTYNDWTAILTRHLGLAASDRAEVDPVRWRKQMIRVAALAVAAVQSHDRKTTAGRYEKGSGY